MNRVLEYGLAIVIAGGVGYWMLADRIGADDAIPVAEQSAAAGRPGQGQQQGGTRSALVTLEQAVTRPYATEYQAIGSIEAVARVAVQSDVSGRVDQIAFTPGTAVNKGDALLHLDQRSEELNLASAQAQLAEVTATLARLERLATSSTSVSTVQLDEAHTAVELARVEADRAEFELQRRVIKAPLSGQVGLTDLVAGSYVNAGSDIVTISALDRVKVSFALPEGATEVLEPGASVRVTLPSRPGQVLWAEVSAIATEIDPGTRLIEVEALMDNAAAGLTHGMIAEIYLRAERPALPSIPAVAVMWGRDGASVFVAEDGIARRVPVTIASRVDDMVWVHADLKQGDKIVVEGAHKLQEGGRVMTADAATRAEGEPGQLAATTTSVPAASARQVAATATSTAVGRDD
ncbi:efflux RND transporter periplasmic adaptor subunit [Paracoccus homiensis]|uniref:Membrane fusion protein, multidrug efflux system n=1 Tax=Paracoccus homiensis TaxID=364199 RepID=A0A1I0HWD9_9RHOB|nr:efflux RND transporter periplasmic adaptor subunit [Paracoccus homiensis]SET88563.1 membrane fusion protein, multidrug efflux system [Paracoccus homiensis]